MKKKDNRKVIASIILVPILLLAVLSGPYLLTHSERGIGLNISAPAAVINSLVTKVKEGTFFEYYAGKMKWNLADTFPVYIGNSMKYLLLSAAISLTAGVFGALILSAKRRRWIYEILGFLSIIPDFLFALIMQLIVVTVYQASGIHIARTASMGSEYQAYILPLLTMVSVSLLFVIQSASIHYNYIHNRPFISFAKSLGFSKRKIKYLHILSGVLHYLRSDIPKLTAILFGSLFITERIFSIPGITRFIFGYAFETGRAIAYAQMRGDTFIPQMNIALAALLSLIMMYYFITLSLNILIRCTEFLITKVRSAS